MKIYIKIAIQFNPNSQITDYIIGEDLLGMIPSLGDSFLLLSDKSVFPLYGEKLVSRLQTKGKSVAVSLIESGEASKDLYHLESIIKPFFKTTIKRNTTLLALGGGVVTDIGGFIAATLLRGIPQVSIPTTLLAQVDASIGGKNGMNITINGKTYKNMVGTISQPKMVISDIGLLRSLPEKEIKSGLGEIAKYSIGWGMPKSPNLLSSTDLLEMVTACQKLKLDIIKKDPEDKLLIRQSLNFGHTIGHAIEGASLDRLPHGEAVSIGLAAASFISLRMGFIGSVLHQENISLLQSLNLPTKAKDIIPGDVIKLMSQDKKGGTFVLLKGKYKLITNVQVPENIIAETLKEILS